MTPFPPSSSTPASAGPRFFAKLSLLWLLVIAFVTFLSWAAWFEIDQTVRAQGLMIASARTQIIQAADGGVLAEILVQEGQAVKAGERLAVLEKERSTAAFEESRAKVAALQAGLIRARAESDGKKPVFGSDLKGFPEFVSAQQRLFDQRKASLRDATGSLEDTLRLAREELQMTQALLTAGDVSRIEVMRALRQVGELEARLAELRNKYVQEARLEVTRIEEDLSSNRYKLDDRRSVLEHSDLVAPVAGIIKYLKITTIGGVLRAGDELMQISPTESDMVVEARINPVDIGQLKLGLPVQIKLDAFDYSVYGMLQGQLSYISSDTLTEQGANGQAQTYYRAHVKITPKQDNLMLAKVVLKPGMTATIDVQTQTRSVLRYLVKPLIKTFGGALNER
jgi:adhesin transport system membrane fusion protein